MNRPLSVFKNDTWVKPYLFQYKKALCYSLGLGILAMIFACALMFTSGYLISISAEQPDMGVYALFGVLGFVQIFGIGKPFLSYFERLYSHDWILHTTSKLRARLYAALEKDSIFWHTTHQAGEILGLLNEDIAHVQNLYLRTVFPSVISLVLWVLVSLIFGFFSPVFGVGILIILGVLIFLLPYVSVLVNRARSLRKKELTNELYTQAYDNVLGITDWILAGKQRAFVESITAIDEQMKEETQKQNAFNRKRDFLAQLVFIIAATLILVWAIVFFGCASQSPAQISVLGRPADWVAAFVLGFFPLLEAFSPLSNGWVEASNHFNSIERFNSLDAVEKGSVAHVGSASAGSTDTASRSACGTSTASVQADQAAQATVAEKPATTPVSNEVTISIRNVSFAYESDAQQVLNNLSLEIKPGSKVAILGPSGSGKSTLASLIRGDLAPASGEVLLGETKTCNLADEMHRFISVMKQDPYLFNRTLFQNVALGNPDASEEEVIDALNHVELGYLLERLPEGVNTMIDEAGVGFSGGEAHRIALARILVSKAPIVILDEPTLGLDPLTEKALLSTMFSVLADRTIIMITHHLLGCNAMDRIVFLKNGAISIDGEPHELAETNSYYRRLLELDLGWVEKA